MNIFNSTSDVNAYVSAFVGTREKLETSSNAFALASRKDLYTMLGEAKIVCDQLLRVANRIANGEAVDDADLLHDQSVADALQERQIKPAKPGANKYGPLIKMLFGSPDPGAKKVSFEGRKNLTKFDPNRSAEKYALVMHWFDMYGVTSDFVGALENVEGKMNAAIAEASLDLRAKVNPSVAPEAPEVIEDRVKLLLKEDDYQVVDRLKIEVPTDQGKFGLLWFENVNGEVRVRGLYKGKSDTIAKHVEAVAKEREPIMRDRAQVKALAQQEKQDDHVEILATPDILANRMADMASEENEAVCISDNA